MSTAELAEPRSFDSNVAAVVRLLLAGAGLDAVDLAPRVGITKSTMYNRLHGKPWQAAELDRIAAYFEVSPAIFYQPVEQVVQAIRDQNWKLMTAPDLRLVEDLPKSKIGTRGVQLEVPFPTERTLQLVPDLE